MHSPEPQRSYSWHQSHDQATVLFLVPYGTSEADIKVEIEPTGNYLVAGVRGQPPTIKGRLYSRVDSTTSMWQLEPPRSRSRLSARERTNSTTSTASTHSSYAFISDPEISSSFAASLESGPVSDSEDISSPLGFSSPNLSSGDIHEGAFPPHRVGSSHPVSRSVSPGHAQRSLPSSYYSSLESLHSHRAGRLLTLHLEKQQSIIWPSLIVGPAPDTLSPPIANSIVFDASDELEHQYNMDPTSLILIALDLLDIRKNKEEAFEYFLRAWHQAHTPSATMKLVSQYLPLQATADLVESVKPAARGTTSYYVQCMGGSSGLAQLYLEAGMLHLEGAASALLMSSSSSLSSLRVALPIPSGEGGTDAWKRDREAAGKYFERARLLRPSLDTPTLPPPGLISRNPSEQLEMPSLELHCSPEPARRRRKLKEETTLFHNREAKLDDLDNTWYLYIPGLVGAGTALLVVGAGNTSNMTPNRVLVILNQPFSETLFLRLWNSSQWHCCADGGANRLFDTMGAQRSLYLPDLIKGDLDSIRNDVKDFYISHGVPVVEDPDQYSTDLMKCVSAIQDKEAKEQRGEYDIILLGGLAGRLDQTIHTLSYLHKLRKSRKRVFAVTDDNVGWVLDAGEHTIHIDHSILGPTCGLLPVGIDSTVLSTTGLRWNLSNNESSFDGMVSTSNHLVPEENEVWIKTTNPIWWTAELRIFPESRLQYVSHTICP
ncbi:thiamine pyrophosphokinase [Mycena maculata]|uniref:Thiamine pyrophosphokinase n=1 Tax=Mycena maculata TaxID=230809 RepID=A0AAD7HU82_9AGAR|nr:thiamine pyrophosphokinase [Mycena maculata]